MEGTHETEIGMRENMLYEASVSGNTESLRKLIEEDRLTLSRSSLTCFDENPLHIVAMQGHLDFAKALVTLKKDLVSDLDSKGRSPLHLASANGYIEIVKVLLMVNPNVCLVRDEDRRTPLHVAAMKGRVDVVSQLVQARPEVAKFKLDRGQTVLHLCVAYNRLEVLKLLISFSTVEDTWVNDKLDNGNTILHIATNLKQVETIRYLLQETAVEVNAANGNGITALDIIEHMPIRDLKAVEISKLLMQAGGHIGHQLRDHGKILASQPPSLVNGTLKPPTKKDDWLHRKRDGLLISATVIAGMVYQSGISPPDGLKSNVKSNLDTITTMSPYFLGFQIPNTRAFWIANTTTFVASLTIMLLLVSGLTLKNRIVRWTLLFAMWVTITTLVITYSTLMAANWAELMLWPYFNARDIVIVIWVYLCLGLTFIVFLVHTCRCIIWIIRKVCKCINRRNTNEIEGGHRQGQVQV
ncbi:ankyrin repeat-containing protein BDA1-like [Camellia sinensis]|uniref:ankyrin repeat-containing protein BDA1-like n=1 Tax=Camellia sinensis TaxID=4442 RepID=UPI0010356330|nr:ankyrin repeat-containing protein BDA1-like [Camellia sinensis]